MNKFYRFIHEGCSIDIESWQDRDGLPRWSFWVMNARNQALACGAHNSSVPDALAAAKDRIRVLKQMQLL